MTNNILKTITDLIKAITPFVVAFLARVSGKQKERLDNAEKVIESVERAKNAVNRDDDYMLERLSKYDEAKNNK